MNNKVAILLGSENDMKYVEGSYKYSLSILNRGVCLCLKIGNQ